MTGAGEHVDRLPDRRAARRARAAGRRRAVDPRRLPRGRPPRAHAARTPSSRSSTPRCGRIPARSTTTSRTRPARCAPRSTPRSTSPPPPAPTTRSSPAPGPPSSACSATRTAARGAGHRRWPRAFAAEPVDEEWARVARRLMHPFPLAGAVGLAIFLVVRRRHLGKRRARARRARGRSRSPCGASASSSRPTSPALIEDVGQRLGKWTYLLVGALAFLETGAFVGLVAPGESAILIGGVVAGQGQISIYVLIGIVWACAVAGDLTSYTLGRRLGRGFLERHGPRLKITEERLQYVEDFFDRRGGMTILIGRFIGLVRAIAPFIAGASRMELRKFLPYDVLGAGLWSTLFCLLGYFFWQSLDKVEAYIGARRRRVQRARRGRPRRSGSSVKLRRDEAFRAKVQEPARRQPDVPARAQAAVLRRRPRDVRARADHAARARRGRHLRVLRARRAARPGASPPRRSTARRSTSSTPLYIDSAGERHPRPHPRSARIRSPRLLVIATAIWAARHQRAREGIALVVAHLLTFVAVHLAKDCGGPPAPQRRRTPTPRGSPIPPAIPPTRSRGSPARSCWRAAATTGRRASRS